MILYANLLDARSLAAASKQTSNIGVAQQPIKVLSNRHILMGNNLSSWT